MKNKAEKKLSLSEARKIILSSQGLIKSGHFGKGLEGARQAIRHLGYVQIDTISVVERAHHHVLWSRVQDYEPQFLSQLMAEKSIFEYWSHAAAYLPMDDFRFSLPRKQLFASGQRKWFPPTSEHLKLKKSVYARIRSEGPLAARDFENARQKGSGWWDWKPAKKALEQLFLEGRLMVAGRKGFQKIYDLTERVLPSDVNQKIPTETEMARHLILKSIATHGLIRPDEITYQRSSLRDAVAKECEILLKEQFLTRLRVEGIERPYYGLAGDWENSLKGSLSKKIQILSPFDNQVIQRKRLKDLFGFDYTIECYVPMAKRQYGYFSLPLLRGDQFIGRIDAKADRKEKVLTVRSLHLEKGCGRKSNLWMEAQSSLSEFALFNGCSRVVKGF